MLLLFDIDGTLLAGAAEAHRQALEEAVREVHRIAPRPVETPGRTDAWITREMLLQAGIDAKRIDDRAEDVRAAAVDAYARLCPQDLSAFVVAGVTDALAALEGHTLALVTGNYEPIARLKLTRAGLGTWFARGPGGFGSDHEDRAALPAVARRRAGRAGRSHPREDTVVIGDTPLDVACARADGVRCIGVLSGPFGKAELAGADAVVGSVAEVPAALARLG